MNCMQGDLAYVVRSLNGSNDGMVVRCIRLIGDYHGWGDVWETDAALRWKTPSSIVYAKAAPDECLRPLRGDLLDDETERELARVVSA